MAFLLVEAETSIQRSGRCRAGWYGFGNDSTYRSTRSHRSRAMLPDMAMWHYAIGSQTFGPVSDEVIRSLATQGVLGPTASILPQGSASWTPLYVHETSLGLSRTVAGGYVAAAPPSAVSAGARSTPPPPPPPPPPSVFYPPPPSSYREVGATTGPNGMDLAGWWSRVAAALIDG